MARSLRSILLLCGTLGTAAVNATHLVGGNIGYRYLGETAPGSGLYRYAVYMEFYMNGGSNSNFQSLHELLSLPGSGPVQVGVYPQDPLAPDADKLRLTSVALVLTDSMEIVPDLPNGCTIGQGLRTLKGVFTGTVDLPLSFSGYHLYYQMCCRNNGILNLSDASTTGIGYYAFIPPTLVDNSTPEFLGVPVPFLCVGDTSTFVNSATDPDGDLLIFSFERPYNSVISSGGIIPPPDVLPWPVPEVTYLPGFSVAQPLGAAGHAFIQGATGLTRYVPPQQGNSVIAVEVKEYRNGQLIGRTRRDLQLQAIACAGNNAAVMGAGIPTTYEVPAGATLCFDMSFTDPDADSLTLVASGSIFDPLQQSPPATIDSPVPGNGTVSSQFCWSTTCAQAQDQPYLFSVSATDNGCPPKTADVVFQVHVQPFAGPQAITGPQQVCAFATGAGYSVPATANAQFAWSVSGGTLSGGQGSPAITVDWGAAGAGTVSVSATNDLGCTSAPIDLAVTIAPPPTADAGADLVLCLGDTGTIGGAPAGPPGSSFAWTPTAGLGDAASPNPEAFPLDVTAYVLAVSNGGCTARDTVLVIPSSPHADAGADLSLCLGDTTTLAASGSGSFAWDPATGLSAADIAAPSAFPLVTTDYALLMTDSIGCTDRDTVRVTVHALPEADAGDDASICPGRTIALGGAPTGPGGSTFAWTPSTGLSDPEAANPDATPAVVTTYIVTVTDAHQCTAVDSITVDLLPGPVTSAGSDVHVCLGDSVPLSATGAGTFAWSPVTGLSDPALPDPWASPVQTTTYVVTLTDGSTCTATDTVRVTVVGLPVADAGPDVWACPGFDVQLHGTGGGTAAWSPTTDLDDPAILAPLASPPNTTTYTLTITDGNGCTASDAAQVLVSAQPPVDAGADASTCVGQPVVLGGSPTSVPGATFLWTPPDGLSDATATNPAASPTAPTTYVLTVTSDTCTARDSVTVLLQGLSTVDFAVRIEPGCDDVRAFLTPDGPAAATYLWDFSDGTTSSDPAPLHTFPYDEPITVMVTATDAAGCSATRTHTFPVGSFDTLVNGILPNVFTPNNDGKNDVFGVPGDARIGACGQLVVFNRWGQKVFESLGRAMTWDGRDFAGQACTNGTYFYTFSVRELQVNGTVQLQR